MHFVNIYSRTPEIETANLSQCYGGLNLFQFQAFCLFRTDLNTTIKNFGTIQLMLAIA